MIQPRSRPLLTSPAGWTVITAMLVIFLLAPCYAAGESLPGDPFQGRITFADKLCTRCHSVWGHGGTLGPDMSLAVSGKSWLDLVGDFWNHTPRMIDALQNQGHPWPALDHREMADLLSYLYFLRLFDAPGDADRGAIAYSQLGCAGCHELGGRGRSVGGRLDAFSAYPSVMILAQAMWNAGPAMQREQIRQGSEIPEFAGDEMAEIQAYIRSQGIRSDRTVKLIPLLDPARGAAVFRDKRCGSCHRSGGEGPDLTTAALDRTSSEISGILWNHSYAMHDRMQARGIAFPRFEGTELGDLIAYLYFLSFLDERGDASVGAEVFRVKGCARCHESAEGIAPNLAAGQAVDSMFFSTAMWNHAPGMHDLMARQSVSWPKFDPGDMENIIAYLRQLSPARRSGGE